MRRPRPGYPAFFAGERLSQPVSQTKRPRQGKYFMQFDLFRQKSKRSFLEGSRPFLYDRAGGICIDDQNVFRHHCTEEAEGIRPFTGKGSGICGHDDADVPGD